MVKPLVPIPDGHVDFTKRIRNVSVRYLNAQKPTGQDLDKWIVVPLYQEGQDMPLDDDGKSALLVANVNTMYSLLKAYEKRMKQDEEEEEKPKGRRHEDGGEESKKRRGGDKNDGEYRIPKRSKEETSEKKQKVSPTTATDDSMDD